MGLTGNPIINYRLYRVTAPEFIPCFPSFKSQYWATEIPRGFLLKFTAEAEADLWEVEFYDPNNTDYPAKKGLVGSWSFQWLLPVFQKNR